MAKPLNKLKEKKEWAFEELKKKITSQPVLSLSKEEGKFRVETDTSGHVIKGVLLQEQEGKWKLVVFLSRMI